jgi:acyl-CoA reductase-like NAD-dependent aldehyde dehydrogenase
MPNVLTASQACDGTASIDVTNPYTGEVVGSVPRLRPVDVDRILASLKPAGEMLTARRRAAVLHAAASALRDRRDEFATLITREAGACIKESRSEVDRACTNLTVAAEEAERIFGEALPVSIRDEPRLAVTLREPVGRVAAITPYNRPLNQVVVKVAPAIAAGNAVAVKPSEKAPLTCLKLRELLRECGLPEAAFEVVTGDPDVIGVALASSPLIDMLTFTGGTTTGEQVARLAAGKKLTLELGGNDPLIVLDDGDLFRAAQLVADQAFATAGQSCRGIKRVIVADRVADEFVNLLADRAAAKRWGDPFDPDTDVGPLIDAAAAEVVEARVIAAVEADARLIVGGERDRALLAPVVLDEVSPHVELVMRETFGPVAPVIRVRDDREAVAVANLTAYGLQAGVVTPDFERFIRIAGALRVGGVALMDGPAFDSPHIPFGGVKSSGLGREGIRYAISEMTVVKTLVLPGPTPLREEHAWT